MNVVPTPTPSDLPIGKLEPTRPSRKSASLGSSSVLMSQPYIPPAPAGYTLPPNSATFPELPAVSAPSYVIPPPPSTPLLTAQPLPPRPVSRGWALVACLLGLACVGSGVAYALVRAATQEPVEIAQKPDAFSGSILPPAPADQGAGKLADPGFWPKDPRPAVVDASVRKSEDVPSRAVEPFEPIALRPADRDPAPPMWKPIAKVPGLEQKDIDEAIRLGVAYLKKNQQINGTWQNGGHQVGYAALPGLTLLECGVPAKDSSVKLAASFVRNNVATLNATYELALSILFLDRLGEPKDKGLIQAMALRLVAGQLDNGGWSYHCPVLPPEQSQPLLTFLKANRPPRFENPLPNGPGLDNPLGKNDPKLLNPLGPPDQKLPNPLLKPGDPAFSNPLPKTGEPGLLNPLGKPGDGKPLTPDEKKLIPPLQTGPSTDPAKPDPTQPPSVKPADPKAAPMPNPTPKLKPKANLPKNAHRPDFLPPNLRDLPIVMEIGKGKGRAGAMRLGRDDNSNSQFALLALWAARRHDVPTERTLQLAQKRYQQGQHDDGGWGYQLLRGGSTPSMTCVGLLGLAMGHGVTSDKPDAAKPPQADPAIQRGLEALGRSIGAPLSAGQPSMENLYFLWSVERVAMLYNLPTISGKDWYGWGAQLLVKNQQPAGSWRSGHYPGSDSTIDTCFALLFLKRSNLVHDLTQDLPRFVTIIQSQK